MTVVSRGLIYGRLTESFSPRCESERRFFGVKERHDRWNNGQFEWCWFSYDNVTFTASWNFAGLATQLPAAYYTAELDAATITNVSEGTALDGDDNGIPGGNYRTTVYVAIPGDANLDGDVDVFELALVDGQIRNVGDFAILKSNLGSTTNVGWSSGDFNADGDIDAFEFRLGVGNVGDLAVLYAQLGQNVRTPVAASNSRLISRSSDSEIADTASDIENVEIAKDEDWVASELPKSDPVPTVAILPESAEEFVWVNSPVEPTLNLLGTPINFTAMDITANLDFSVRSNSWLSAAVLAQPQHSSVADLCRIGNSISRSIVSRTSKRWTGCESSAVVLRDHVFSDLTEEPFGFRVLNNLLKPFSCPVVCDLAGQGF